MTVSVIIPTYNAKRFLPRLIKKLKEQTIFPFEILIVDSSSPDGSAELAQSLGAQVFVIPKEEFNHGTTRTLAGKRARGEILVYLTQDALPAQREAIEKLIAPLGKDKIAISYGRQIPTSDVGFLAALHRSFNYPSQSRVFSLEDRTRFGLRTVFCSNSFAAYWREALEEIGWFKTLPCSEDVHATARLILHGWRLAYVAEAQVYHAHQLSLREEFRRYYRLGRFYRQEAWILKEFGRVENEGQRYIKFVLRHLWRQGRWALIPYFFLQTGIRYLGYQLGRRF